MWSRPIHKPIYSQPVRAASPPQLVGSSGMSDTDRRSDDRKDVDISASVQSIDGSRIASCLIRNASKNGCQIVLSRVDDLPDTICIKIPGLKSPRKGEIVWRTKNRAGVKFAC